MQLHCRAFTYQGKIIGAVKRSRAISCETKKTLHTCRQFPVWQLIRQLIMFNSNSNQYRLKVSFSVPSKRQEVKLSIKWNARDHVFQSIRSCAFPLINCFTLCQWLWVTWYHSVMVIILALNCNSLSWPVNDEKYVIVICRKRDMYSLPVWPILAGSRARVQPHAHRGEPDLGCLLAALLPLSTQQPSCVANHFRQLAVHRRRDLARSHYGRVVLPWRPAHRRGLLRQPASSARLEYLYQISRL